MVTIPIYLFTNKISKKKLNFLGGCPPFGPFKVKPPKNEPHDCL